MIKIPRCMSTQHPDNVRAPFFSDNAVLHGEDEIKEAFYAFSHLRCDEQLWDFEGKEVDAFVVKKLLTKYETFFAKNKLGRDVFLTLRVPNPEVEKDEAKILLETLESIPRAYDAAKVFYNNLGSEMDIAPIFEVALPMVNNHKDIARVARYYSKFVTGKANKKLLNKDITIEAWIGSFKPEKIKVIPLIETKDSMINADRITQEYINEEKIKDYQRVWLARSDPALNYGSLSAVLIVKIALQKLYALEEKTSIDIYPILGCGSSPFRGNLKPTNVDNCLQGYPSVQTFTLQSAFKYDYDERQVQNSVDVLNTTVRKKAHFVDEKKCEAIIEKVSEEYSKDIKLIAPMITRMSEHIPMRRKRKLHIGLFGYAREQKGVKLPRAIGFCASMYSYGFPPELLGLSALTEKDVDYVRDVYPSFEPDMKDMLRFFNRKNLMLFPQALRKKVHKTLEILNIDYHADEKHNKITSIIAKDLKQKNLASLSENIERAGYFRGFLG